MSVADTLEFRNADLGKRVYLSRDQKLLIVLKLDPTVHGRWTLEGGNKQMLMLLSTNVRGQNPVDFVWLYQARAMGYCTLKFVYTPYDASAPVKEYPTSIWVKNQS